MFRRLGGKPLGHLREVHSRQGNSWPARRPSGSAYMACCSVGNEDGKL